MPTSDALPVETPITLPPIAPMPAVPPTPAPSAPAEAHLLHATIVTLAALGERVGLQTGEIHALTARIEGMVGRIDGLTACSADLARAAGSLERAAGDLTQQASACRAAQAAHAEVVRVEEAGIEAAAKVERIKVDARWKAIRAVGTRAWEVANKPAAIVAFAFAYWLFGTVTGVPLPLVGKQIEAVMPAAGSPVPTATTGTPGEPPTPTPAADPDPTPAPAAVATPPGSPLSANP